MDFLLPEGCFGDDHCKTGEKIWTITKAFPIIRTTGASRLQVSCHFLKKITCTNRKRLNPIKDPIFLPCPFVCDGEFQSKPV